MSIYDFKVKNREGEDVSLNKYRGKVLLIVNTATGCGFTPQYEGLEKLYKKYHEQGLEILDFPCDQFGHQAPGSDEEIHQFCTLKYNTTFDQLAKVEVNGDKAEPLFNYLKKEKGGFIKWNFTKFLVSRDGKIVARFSPMTKPEKFENKIKKLLEEK
ncbi:glutathione peroxidase [Candidatus Saccharibacteria bacterium]|nr:glutathione peroxidase [Candidatus Saccharibacteria bacterium]